MSAAVRPHAKASSRCARARARSAAELLDQELRRLAHEDVHARIVTGEICDRLQARRGHQQLGFARLDDYARERLGVSGAELRSLSRVWRALDARPAIDGAFRRGELGWTKLRVLAAVASSETEGVWLSIARICTAEGLRRVAKSAKDGGRLSRLADAAGAAETTSMAPERVRELVSELLGPGTPAPWRVSPDPDLEDPEQIDGEEVVRFRLRCPPRVRRLWRSVETLAKKVCGAELTAWEAAEAVAAEGLSLTGFDTHTTDADAGIGSTAEKRSDERNGAGGRTDDRSGACRSNDERSGQCSPHGSGESDSSESGGGIVSSIVALRPGPGVATNGASDVSGVISIAAGEITSTGPLAEGIDELDPHEIDSRLRSIFDMRQRIDGQLGHLLNTFCRARLYRELGYSTAPSYVRERLGLCPRKARGLLALTRAGTAGSAALIVAYREGDISWLRALTLMPIVDALNAPAWLQRAREVTLRRLRDEVDWALDQLDRGVVGRSPAPPPDDADLSQHRAAPAVGQSSHEAKWQIGNSALGAEAGVDGCNALPPMTEIEIRGPASVLALFASAIDAFGLPFESRWCRLERLLLHVRHEWESQSRHRDPVFERDGWRCAVPACSSRRELHDHHIVFRSHGGGNQRDNRITVCASHHHHGIHAGRIRAEGSVREGIVWTLGVRADGQPLMRLRGDRYLDVASGQLAASAA
jgi:hypothetical protein